MYLESLYLDYNGQLKLNLRQRGRGRPRYIKLSPHNAPT